MPAFEWNDGERDHYQRMFALLGDHLDEKATRLLGAAMALSLGDGSHSAIRAITGLAMDTLQLGVAQLRGDEPVPAEGVRRPGGGRKPITEIYPDIVPALLQLVGEDTQGDPESPLGALKFQCTSMRSDWTRERHRAKPSGCGPIWPMP